MIMIIVMIKMMTTVAILCTGEDGRVGVRAAAVGDDVRAQAVGRRTHRLRGPPVINENDDDRNDDKSTH